MVDLYCTPFVDLIDRMRLEYRTRSSMFDLPEKKWFKPPPDSPPAYPDGPDLTVTFHGRRAGNPVGPAAGPQTQMAQNLILAWLAGSRILELKTVQINDRLEIPRPCIDATNIGYNVEWSQELRLSESLDQYVQGAMLIHMLRHSPDTFGNPFGETPMDGVFGETLFDMSVGYDLKGIQSEPVRRFLDGMLDASGEIARLLDQLPDRLKHLRDLDYPTRLSDSITLSTFHGCPADEIERICAFLLTEIGVDVIVKMNPPMLGKEKLEYLLHDLMGYHEVTVNPSAYTSGLLFDESIQICKRLDALAKKHGRSFGAKFSNTLEVVNHRDFFTPDNKVMYLSGPPLHVITLTLAHEFRLALGHEMPITFSAGVDRKNFPNMVACGFKPITTCTDLLKPGGYSRLPGYLGDLAATMTKCGAATVDEYLLKARGHGEEAGGDPVLAGFLNTADIVTETQADERYYQKNNQLVPKRINSHLVVFDCITCNKCIPVCPNDANFLYETPKADLSYRDVLVSPDGSVTEVGEAKRFTVERTEQIANFADYCNHCGNCDTFCPEYDGPYIKKPSFFGSRKAFDAGAPHDGFLIEASGGGLTLHGRMEGASLRLERLDASGDGWRFMDGQVALLIRDRHVEGLAPGSVPPDQTHIVDLGRFHTMRVLLAGITDPGRVHQVNTRLVATSPAG
jgi:putative selenate reductase